MQKNHIGVLGTGIYLPSEVMTAGEIAERTKGIWTEKNIIEKLGIIEKPVPGEGDGTQEMGVYAAKDALKRTGLDPEKIDLILCVGEEWKEYPLTTSGIYIQEQIGAVNAWAIDVQQRCCSTVSAIKIAKDMLLGDDEITTAMVVGGYRNGDLVNYEDPQLSMMYNLSAGGGAIILQKNLGRNIVLGSHVMSDGSMARDAGVRIGGICEPITKQNAHIAYQSLELMDSEHMKNRLNEISMDNWLHCIDRACEKSNIDRRDIDYLAILHFKRSMHKVMLNLLKKEESQAIYLEKYGHMGQIDQILSLHLGLQSGQIKEGSHVALIAAGIGYAWAAGIIRWGALEE